MATFLHDTFTDTNGTTLTAHSPNSGGQWHVSGTNLLQVGSASSYAGLVAVSPGAGKDYLYYNDAAPTGADYSVVCSVVFANSTGASGNFGVIGRCDSSFVNYYWGVYDKAASQWAIYKKVGGSTSKLAFLNESISVGTTYNLVLSMSGSSINLLANGVIKCQVVDTAITQIGYAGIRLQDTLPGNSWVYQLVDSGASAYTLVASAGSGASGGVSGAFVVTPSSAISCTITPSDSGAGGTFSPAILTFASSAAPQSFRYSPLTVGQKSISTANNAGLVDPASVTFSSTNESWVSPSDPNLYYSPFNWDLSSNTRAYADCGGAYLKVGFTGTSLTLLFDPTNIMGSFPKLVYSIDNSALTTTNLTSSGRVLLQSGLSAGSHTVQLWIAAIDHINRWTAQTQPPIPTDGFCFLGFILDPSATSLAPGGQISLKTKTCLAYGDSIAEGCGLLSSGSTVSSSDGSQSLVSLIAEGMQWEIGIIGYQGQGWTNSGVGNVPNLGSAFGYHYSGKVRSFATQPDYVLILHGTNGSPSAASILSTLQSIRASLSTSKIVLCVPPGGFSRSNIAAAYATWGDTNSVFVDLGSANDLPSSINPYNLEGSAHPSARGCSHYAPMYVQRIQAALSQGVVNSSSNLRNSSIGQGLFAIG